MDTNEIIALEPITEIVEEVSTSRNSNLLKTGTKVGLVVGAGILAYHGIKALVKKRKQKSCSEYVDTSSIEYEVCDSKLDEEN